MKYLPGASGFEGIVINSYLFDLYGVSVPSDKQSFIEACKAFSERGVEPLAAGMADTEICYEVMQGSPMLRWCPRRKTFFESGVEARFELGFRRCFLVPRCAFVFE